MPMFRFLHTHHLFPTGDASERDDRSPAGEGFHAIRRGVLLLLAAAFLLPTSNAWPQSAPRALIVMTSRDVMISKNRATGYRLAEVAQVWNVFHRAGIRMTFASARGGRVTPDSTGFSAGDSVAQRFTADTAVQRALQETRAIGLLKPESFDVVLYIGGHGALWEFLEDPVFATVASAIHGRGGVLATIGHGAAVLLTTTMPSGASILSNAKLTSSSDEEEERDGFDHDIPYFLETALRRGGSTYYRASAHSSNVVADDRLITGQNSESARETAENVVLKLKRMGRKWE
jgi:putative intracellular protease/amidase